MNFIPVIKTIPLDLIAVSSLLKAFSEWTSPDRSHLYNGNSSALYTTNPKDLLDTALQIVWDGSFWREMVLSAMPEHLLATREKVLKIPMFSNKYLTKKPHLKSSRVSRKLFWSSSWNFLALENIFLHSLFHWKSRAGATLKHTLYSDKLTNLGILGSCCKLQEVRGSKKLSGYFNLC